MKKLLTSTLAVLAISVTANAQGTNTQGTWYTDQALWQSRLTSVGGTAEYNSLGGGFRTGPYTESGVTATAAGGFFTDTRYGALSTNNNSNTALEFTFSGNAFGGMFGMTDSNFNFLADGMNFSVFDNGSFTDGYNMTSTATTNTYTFLGYISDSAANISVRAYGDTSPQYYMVDSFSFGNGTNPAAPGGAVPEPGTVVSMGLLGAGVLGLVIRSRRRISN